MYSVVVLNCGSEYITPHNLLEHRFLTLPNWRSLIFLSLPNWRNLIFFVSAELEKFDIFCLCRIGEMSDVRLKEMKSWGTDDNVCMIAAVMPMMNEEQWEYCTMGNTIDVRDVFKTALGLNVDEKFEDGISARDMHKVFSYVVEENYKRGIKLGFEWRRLRPTGGFQVSRLKEFLLSRKGRYVLLGKTKEKNDKWEALIKRLKKAKKHDNQLSLYAKTSSDKVPKEKMDHAMGLLVESEITCFNNGYKSGMLPYSVMNMATQMESINEGYYVDLFKIY